MIPRFLTALRMSGKEHVRGFIAFSLFAIVLLAVCGSKAIMVYAQFSDEQGIQIFRELGEHDQRLKTVEQKIEAHCIKQEGEKIAERLAAVELTLKLLMYPVIGTFGGVFTILIRDVSPFIMKALASKYKKPEDEEEPEPHKRVHKKVT